MSWGDTITVGTVSDDGVKVSVFLDEDNWPRRISVIGSSSAEGSHQAVEEGLASVGFALRKGESLSGACWEAGEADREEVVVLDRKFLDPVDCCTDHEDCAQCLDLGRACFAHAPMAMIWNQVKNGNVCVTDGEADFWATFPESTTAQEALDEYMSTADYSGATRAFEVTATVLAGVHEGDMASTTYEPS